MLFVLMVCVDDIVLDNDPAATGAVANKLMVHKIFPHNIALIDVVPLTPFVLVVALVDVGVILLFPFPSLFSL
jgi:hypothetical protein